MLFPISLVLFELSVYIANDMIQPAMLLVVKDFNEDIKWVPTALTAYLAGGVCLQWFFGPLSDKLGRRPVMLFGVCFFIINCLSIILSLTIKQFIFFRFLQGIGLCFIGSVGYASIQESFKTKICIRIIALMSNIALLAPLLGPLCGSILITMFSWRDMFIMFAVFGGFSLVGLFFFMPETVIRQKITSIFNVFILYKEIFKNKKLILGSLSIGFANLPLLSWIALSPVILTSGKQLTIIDYSLLQLPIFGSLIFGNIFLSLFINKRKVNDLINFGVKFIILGLLISSLSYFVEYYVYITVIGLCMYGFGLGVSNASLTRITLFSSNISKGIVSSSIGMISMFIVITGVEISKNFYLTYRNENNFNLFNLIACIIMFILIKFFFKKIKNLNELKPQL